MNQSTASDSLLNRQLCWFPKFYLLSALNSKSVQNVAILRRCSGSSTTVVFLGNVSASERQGDNVGRDKRHDVHRWDGQHCGHSLYHAKQINVTKLLTSTLNAMRIAIISVHFVTVPRDSVRAFVGCHRQLPYTTYFYEVPHNIYHVR